MLSIFSSAGIKTGIKADSYFLGKIRNKCYFTSLQSEIIELTTTCLLVVIFEGMWITNKLIRNIFAT